MPNPSCQIAVLISGGGSNLQSIIDHIKQGHINASIGCVISNYANAYGLMRAQSENIPTHIIEHKKFSTREAFEQELIKTLEVYKVKLIVLAGFMRILSSTFVSKYPGSIMNIHPSLLPKYPGLHTHARALAANDTEHGCSVHFVNEGLDEGPLILQAKVDVKPTDTAELLAQRVLIKEHIIYPLAVKWFCEQRIQLKNSSVYFDDTKLDKAILLNQEHVSEMQ